MSFQRVAVIGAGEMGRGIAQALAQAGVDVRLYDKYPEALDKGRTAIKASLEALVARGRLDSAQAEGVFNRIIFCTDLAQALSDCQLMIEAVPERLDLKAEVLKQADSLAPKEAVFASNTSNIRITELAGFTNRPELFVGMHFFNPATRIKLVEVIPSEKTTEDTLRRVTDFCAKIGKTPVRLMKDSPGFIVNRITAVGVLLLCMIADRKIALPEEVDSYVRSQGLPMGAYELLDYVGLDVVTDSLNYLSRTVSQDYAKCGVIPRLVSEGRLGKKTGSGFYRWSDGRAVIPPAKPTQAFSILDLFVLEVNEAAKLIEAGVATAEDIETAVRLGMNRPFGPISVYKGLSLGELRKRLSELASKFDCSLFLPADSIKDGRLSAIIQRPQAAGRPEATSQGERRPLLVERPSEKVVRITLNRPGLNLIDADLLSQLEAELQKVRQDASVIVVIFTGAGENFSAGAELSEFVATPMDFVETSRRGQRVFRSITELPKITLAYIRGYALGGGFELALSCDIRVAAENATLGFPEVTLGLLPGWTGTQRLMRLCGLSTASWLILTGERLSAKRAYELGIVNKLLDSGESEEALMRYAVDLSRKVAPSSVSLTKRLLNNGIDAPMDGFLEAEALSLGLLYTTDDFKEGISAFMQKRTPDFKGR